MTTTPRIATSLEALADIGLVDRSDVVSLAPVADRFAIGVSPDMLRLIQAGSEGVARQFLPDVRELETHPSERVDPIGDEAHTPVPGIVHRHADRVLLKLVKVCPVYCRFCFRREMIGPGEDAVLPPDDVATAITYIRERPAIWEVILTGGDPLMLSPRRIADVVGGLSEMPHLKVIRWHTRVPAVAPERVTDELVTAMAGTDKAVFLALHANHPDELTEACRAACEQLARAGIRLVSQSVLLRGVNDQIDVLADLMRGFVEAGITPYYLHHGDLAPGTAHFRIPIARGLELVRNLRRRLSGLCQPEYVLDLPGGFAKIPLLSAAVREISPGQYEIDDGSGRLHRYDDVVAD